MQAASVDLENQTYFEPSTATLSEWVDLWLDEYCENIKYQTKRVYRSQSEKHIKPLLGNIKLSELSPHHIQHFYNTLSKSGKTMKEKIGNKTITKQVPMSPISIQHIGSILSKCLNTAVSVGFIKTNPTRQAVKPRAEKPEIAPLTNDQIKLFLQEIEGHPYEPIFKLYLFTGLRRSEALGVTWDNIDFQNNVITVNHQLIRRSEKDGGYTLAPLKNDKPRYLYIPQFMMDTLEKQKELQDTQKAAAGDLWNYQTNLVFTDQLGEPIKLSTLRENFKKIVAKIGIPNCRIHDLRHTYAVFSIQNGTDIKSDQDNLGHATATFTLEVYAHSTTQMKTKAAEQMQTFFDELSAPKDPWKFSVKFSAKRISNY